MIEEKDIKVGAKFRWDGERVNTSEIDKFNGYHLHQFDTDATDFGYSLSNKSKYPTTFTIVGLDKIDNVECAINDGAMSIVMGKDDIMRFAHLEDAEDEELDDEGSLSIPLKVEFGESTLALHHAEDVATMRQVLLQIMNWFKTGHRKLPLTLRDPFNDSACNELYDVIVEWMKDEKEDKK